MYYIFLIICCISYAISHSQYTDPISAQPLNGRKTRPGEFPFRVSLQWSIPPFEANFHFCSGAIINNTWILTHARCIEAINRYKKLRPIVVKAGKYDLGIVEKSEQISTINDTYLCVYFDQELNKNQQYIGLIQLSKPLHFNLRVAPINLPEANILPNGSVTITGWGSITDKKLFPNYPKFLQASTISILEPQQCYQNLDIISMEQRTDIKNIYSYAEFCTESFIDGAKACGGDFGGPISAITKDGKNELVGIVSWGKLPCTRKELPFVFTRVSFFIEWIYHTINQTLI